MQAYVAESGPVRHKMGWRALGWPSRRAIARTIRLTGAAGFAVGAALWIAHALRNPPTGQPSAPVITSPVWRDITDAAPIYRLEAPDFQLSATTSTARMHVAGGGREDVLSLGTLDGSAPALRLRIFRRASEAPSSVPLFAAIVHEAAQAGLSVERSGLPEILPTRFGRFEIADVGLAGTAGPTRTCSGVRLTLDAPALSITGLACGPDVAPLPRATLTCLVDRLEIARPGTDPELADLFARTATGIDPSCVATRFAPEIAQVSTAEPKTGKPATSRKSLRRKHDL